jgi:hypothetical protein
VSVVLQCYRVSAIVLPRNLSGVRSTRLGTDSSGDLTYGRPLHDYGADSAVSVHNIANVQDSATSNIKHLREPHVVAARSRVAPRQCTFRPTRFGQPGMRRARCEAPRRSGQTAKLLRSLAKSTSPAFPATAPTCAPRGSTSWPLSGALYGAGHVAGSDGLPSSPALRRELTQNPVLRIRVFRASFRA